MIFTFLFILYLPLCNKIILNTNNYTKFSCGLCFNFLDCLLFDYKYIKINKIFLKNNISYIKN